jgi:endothelin-converting enzyme
MMYLSIVCLRDVLYQDPIRTYNPLPLSNLSNSLPQIHFPTYFATFTPRTFPEKVIATYPAYITSLSDILEETAADAIEGYLVIRAALTLSPYLGTNTEVWRAQRSLEELITGIKKGVVGDRAEYCVGKIEEALGFAAGRYFVNETFSEELKEQGAQVIRGQHVANICGVLNHILPRYHRVLQGVTSPHRLDGSEVCQSRC